MNWESFLESCQKVERVAGSLIFEIYIVAFFPQQGQTKNELNILESRLGLY